MWPKIHFMSSYHFVDLRSLNECRNFLIEMCHSEANWNLFHLWCKVISIWFHFRVRSPIHVMWISDVIIHGKNNTLLLKLMLRTKLFNLLFLWIKLFVLNARKTACNQCSATIIFFSILSILSPNRMQNKGWRIHPSISV